MLIKNSTLAMVRDPDLASFMKTAAINNARALVDGGAILTGSATYDPASLADGAGATTTVTVTGARVGDVVEALSFDKDLQGITLTGSVSANDTVQVRFQNESGGVIDLASGTLRARVRKGRAAAITDNSTGTSGPLEAVATQVAKVALSGTNLASRTAFNTAIGKVNDAIHVLSSYLTTNAWAALGLGAPAGFDGTIATAGVIAACDQTVGAGIDGSAGNAMLRAEFNAAVVRQRNNFSSVLKQYNALAVALGVATIADATGGSSNAASYDGSANVTATTAVAAGNVATSDLATKAAGDAALDSLVDNIATLANKITTVLLAPIGTPLPIVLLP